MLSAEQFEALVMEAVTSLPPALQDKISNVEILTKMWPSRAELREAGVPAGHTLFGLYQGVPLTERGSGYHLVAPDVITLYQGPLQEAAGGELAVLRQEVRRTVLHEIAHYFGISDERLHELGAY